MTTPEQFKESGSKAYKDGDFNKAISEWGKAISAADSGDKILLKTLYSNRSAAYLKIKQYSQALKDAESCVSIDSSWAKGYTRKGDALFALSRYTDAFNAYNSGLRNATSDERDPLQTKLEQAMRAIRSQDDSGSTTNTNSASSNNYLAIAQKFMRVCLFISLFCYMLPFSRQLSSLSATFFAVTTVVVRATVVYQKHGMIKFNLEFANRVLSDPSGMGLFLGVLLVMSKPYVLILLSVAVAELSFFAQDIGQYGRANLSQIQTQLGPLLSQYGQSLLQGADPGAIFADLFSQRSVNMLQGQFIAGSAFCEVLQGVFLILELILPTRNFMFTMLWWQYLQMRYMLDRTGDIKSAFKVVDNRIVSLLSNRIVPPIILNYYGQLKLQLAKQVEPPTAGSQRGGLGGGIASALSKCTIM